MIGVKMKKYFLAILGMLQVCLMSCKPIQVSDAETETKSNSKALRQCFFKDDKSRLFFSLEEDSAWKSGS
jgi:hypothetical protein